MPMTLQVFSCIGEVASVCVCMLMCTYYTSINVLCIFRVYIRVCAGFTLRRMTINFIRGACVHKNEVCKYASSICVWCSPG